MSILNIGKTRQVFWDDYLIDTEKTTAFPRLMNPVKKEMCMELGQDAELNSISYPCIVNDGNGYKMYYMPWKKDFSVSLAVLESKDGLTWKRPHLNIFDRPELEENNIVIDNIGDGCFVFYDTNPACPHDEKYKAITLYKMLHPDGETKRSLCCLYSPDGYHFRLSHPMTRFGTFDSLNTAMWDGKRYCCYYRSFHNLPDTDNNAVLTMSEIYHFGGKVVNAATRDIRVMYSDDFVHWSLPELIQFDDGKDYPLYTNNIQIYDRAPEMKIGFPVRYNERKAWTSNELQLKSINHKKDASERVEPRCGLVATDCVFICSRDGKTWHRFNEAFMTPGYEEEHNWIYGDCYLSYGLIDSGKENYYFYTIDRHFSFDVPKALNRHEIRKDGFACYMAGGDEAEIVTKPFVFEGSSLHLNFSTSAYGHIFVSVLDENGEQISDESFEIYGDNIDRTISFADGSDFSRFSGKPIRLKFRMRDAKLFSLKFE